MSIQIEVKIEGMKEVENALNQLPKAAGKSALRTALRKAAKPIAPAAKAYAPVRSGKLKDSIKIMTTVKKSQQGEVKDPKLPHVFVGSTAPHAHLVEFGHAIVRNGEIVGQASPHAFLRPAWDENKNTVLENFKKIIWTELVRQARRLAKKSASGRLNLREIETLSE